MARKEDITKKVKEIVHNSGYNAYPSYLLEIAEWADETMLQKLRKKLQDMFSISVEDIDKFCQDLLEE